MMMVAGRDHVQVATEAFGSSGDPALVLIMGATASMLGWPDALCEALAKQGLYVIRFDHRDTGKSTTVPPGAAGYAVEDMAADVISVLDGYGIRRAHLIGMSLGGYIGQMLALTEPDRVLSLTLVASEPLGWDGDPLPPISDALLAHFAGLATLDWSDRTAVIEFLQLIDRLCASPDHPFDHAASRDLISRVLARTDSPASMFNHASLTTRADWSGRFREIGVPVLVIHGEDDPVLPVENGRAIAAGIAGAEIEILRHVGHELPTRVIDGVQALVAAHIRKATR